MRYIFILIFSSLSLLLIGQTIAEGEAFFNSGQYEKARQTYKALLDKKPYHTLNNYKYARCCYELNLKEEAIAHFRLSDPKITPLCNYYLGELYSNTYQFDISIDTYKAYLATLNKENDKEKIDEIDKKIQQAQIASVLIKRVEDITIIDSIVVDKNNFLSYYNINSDLGTLKQEHILAEADELPADKIYHTTQRQDRIIFSENNNGDMDIYTSYKLLNDWAVPTPANGEINTIANENYPFLMSDGITILYASNRDGSIGGYDIFISKYSPATNSYLMPENVGMPFNSPYNDYMMVIDEHNKIGWFATDRYMPKGKVTIYKFIPNEQKRTIRSDDNDYIREAAQLKTYTKTIITPETQFVDVNSETTTKPVMEIEETKVDTAIFENKAHFIFTINDSLVYNQACQFKNPHARQLYIGLRSLTQELDEAKKELEKLRKQYAEDQIGTIRMELAPQILELEKSIKHHTIDIAEQTLEIRNEEIKHIKNNK